MNNNDLKNIIKPDKTYSDYTTDELKIIIRKSSSINDVIQKLNINRTYHFTISKFIKENNIDTSHFTRKDMRKVENCLKKDCHVSSNSVKNYLIKNNIEEYACEICGIDEWFCGYVVLQLDHINGIHSDNRIENLRLLCPMCHSKTSTFTGRNVKHKEKVKSTCNICETNISRNNVSGLCRVCYLKNREDIENGTFDVQEVIKTYKKQIQDGEYIVNKETRYYIHKCDECQIPLKRKPKNGICL